MDITDAGISMQTNPENQDSECNVLNVVTLRAEKYCEMNVARNEVYETGYRRRSIPHNIISKLQASRKKIPIFFPDVSLVIPILRSLNTFPPRVMQVVARLLTQYTIFYPNLPVHSLLTASTGRKHTTAHSHRAYSCQLVNPSTLSTSSSSHTPSSDNSTSDPKTCPSSEDKASPETKTSPSLLSLVLTSLLAQLAVDRCEANVDAPRDIMREICVMLEVFRSERVFEENEGLRRRLVFPEYLSGWEKIFGFSDVDTCSIRRALLQTLCKRNIADDHSFRWAVTRDTRKPTFSQPPCNSGPSLTAQAHLYSFLYSESFQSRAGALTAASPGEAAEGALMESVGLQGERDKAARKEQVVIQEATAATDQPGDQEGGEGAGMPSNGSSTTAAVAGVSMLSQIAAALTPSLATPSLTLPAVLGGGGGVVSLEHERARVRAQATVMLGCIAAWCGRGHRSGKVVGKNGKMNDFSGSEEMEECTCCAHMSAAACAESQRLLWGAVADPEEIVARNATTAIFRATGCDCPGKNINMLEAMSNVSPTETSIDVDDARAYLNNLPSLMRSLVKNISANNPSASNSADPVPSSSSSSSSSTSSISRALVSLSLPRVDADDTQWLTPEFPIMCLQGSDYIRNPKIPRSFPFLTGRTFSPVIRAWGGQSACTTVSHTSHI